MSFQDTLEVDASLEDETPTVEEVPDIQDVPHSPAVPSRKRKRTTENDLLLKACETLTSVANSEMSSEDALGHYLAQKLKTIKDPAKKNAAEADLMNTLMKYL